MPCNIGRGDQFTAGIPKDEPKSPHAGAGGPRAEGGGAPIVVFESGAIMMYIAEKEGKFCPQDHAAKV